MVEFQTDLQQLLRTHQAQFGDAKLAEVLIEEGLSSV
jgi:hypothetical protein